MAYQKMAYIYDQLMADVPYARWLEFTKETFQKSGRVIHTVADLGCGTGQLTRMLAKDGFQMYGIDYSTDMLSYAEQRASTEKLPIQWIHQDLRTLTGLTNLDAAISYCDVINYITTENEVNEVFNHVASMLKPGGLFLFDVHSMYHVETNLVNQTFAETNDNLAYIWFCSEGDYRGEMFHELTFFAAGEHDSYYRFEEFHHQRTFTVDFYKQLLHETGFKLQSLHGDFSLKDKSIHEKSERIFFVAEKRSGN